MKVTRKDIAAAAGVSPSTVGMILSGQGQNYNPVTRKRVLKTAEKLGYQVSVNARALRLQRSFLFGVLLNEVNAHLSAQFLLGIQSSMGSTDYSPVVFFSKAEVDQEHCLGRCLNRHVDAMIVNCSVDGPEQDRLAAFAARLNRLQIPVVEVYGRFLSGIPSVNVDNAEGGRLGTSHLADLGHQRIALITHERYENSVVHLDAWEQFRGYREVLTARGLEPRVITPKMDLGNVTIPAFVQAGQDSLDLLLSQPERPTAVVCYSDLMAYGLNRACRERGIRVPEDLSIAGNYDMLLSSVVNPPLTTTRSNHFEIGCRAADSLLRALQGETVGDQLVAPDFVARQSTGPVG
ncbi:MAG: LacI family DNA-binding transcriptional regulator [Luteolibacter sp.]